MTAQPSITCPKCGKRSYHPDDIRNQYCGNCHAFHLPACDFCSTLNPTRVYPCTSFDIHAIVPMNPLLSGTDWLACEECAALIDGDDREGLVERAVASFFDRHTVRRLRPEAVRIQLLATYEQFWNSRIRVQS